MSWNEYVSSLQELEAYQKKVRQGYVKDRETYMKGPQDPGVAYPNKPKKTRSKSAPPGFGAIGEEVEEESFEVQTELDPRLWRDNELLPEVRDRLMEIVQDFIDNLSKDVQISDVRLTGSLANYTWSTYSDLDLHVVVDYAEVDENEALVKSFFDAQRMLWNDEHDIEVEGYEVEIYVENVEEKHLSGGVYSILNNEWIVEPVPYEGEIDFATARKKSDDITTQVNLIGHIVRAGKFNSALKSIERLKSKIRRMRRAGLESDAREFSPENIAFKILRREGILKKLNDLKYNVDDKEMSIAERGGYKKR